MSPADAQPTAAPTPAASKTPHLSDPSLSSSPDGPTPSLLSLASAVLALAIGILVALSADAPPPLVAITALNQGPGLLGGLGLFVRYPVSTVRWTALKARLAYKWWAETGVAPGMGQCIHKRFIETNFLTQDECDALIKLGEAALTHQEVGDELSGTNIYELFERNVSSADLEVLRRTRRRMTELVEWAVPNTEKLMPEYTHLTSRTPDTHEYSHGIHSDNCLLSADRKSCVELPDNCCAWRKRTSLVYLNGPPETTGGEFVFADGPECGGDTVVTPRCGLLAGFSSGFENLHGVFRIKSGKRKALAVWFTYEVDRKEMDF